MAIVDIEYEKWQKDFEDEFPDLFKGGSLTGPVTALRRDLMRTAYMAGKKASRQPVGAQCIDLEDVLHKAVDLARGGSSAIAVVGWITSELLDGRDAGTGVKP